MYQHVMGITYVIHIFVYIRRVMCVLFLVCMLLSDLYMGHKVFFNAGNITLDSSRF